MRCIFRTHADRKILEVELNHRSGVDVSCFEIIEDGDNKQAAVTISIVEARAMAAQITASLKHLEEEPTDD
jgi:hypothetical protein